MKDFETRKMFDTIAPGYDFQNSILSLGRDIAWRKTLAAGIQDQGEALILDTATGSAEVAMEICRRLPSAKVVGMDFSWNMLAMAKKKIGAGRVEDSIRLTMGDGRILPFKAGVLDAVTIAFGIRNIEERPMVLAEFERVLKPGGQLLIMEFDFPDDPILRRLYGFYFDYILGPVGNWISRTDYAYTSLVESIRGFPRQRRFMKEIAAAGFVDLKVEKLTFGIAKIYSGIKPKTPSHLPSPP